jgi:hypothetical protein
MELKPLFRKSSTGAILRWTIWTEGAEIVIEHGQLDGRMQISRRACTPKNVGKANETSAETQAEAEALAEWTHKVERKY